MRVLMISDVYFPRVNGVSTSIASFRQGLEQDGVQVDLMAPDYGPAATQAERRSEPGVIRLPARRIPFDPEDRLMSWRAALDQVPQLAQSGYDLIHIQTPFTAHYAGMALARRLKLPVLATYHTLFEEYLHHYIPFLPRTWLQGLARRYSRQQCNELNGVIVPSQAMAERLRAYGVETPMEILPTGIPLERFQGGQREAFRRRHGIAPERPVALFVGRVAHEKNIGFLLEALQQARRLCQEVLLIIAGEGPAQAALQKQAAQAGLTPNVLFLGYMDRQTELPDAYAGADLFVFASRTETQGLVLLEAMAAGLPVLGLSAMGTADILEPQRGCVLGVDEPGNFGLQMGSLLNQAPMLAALADEARAWSQAWSERVMAARLAVFYDKLVRQYHLAHPHLPQGSSPLPRALNSRHLSANG